MIRQGNGANATYIGMDPHARNIGHQLSAALSRSELQLNGVTASIL